MMMMIEKHVCMYDDDDREVGMMMMIER